MFNKDNYPTASEMDQAKEIRTLKVVQKAQTNHASKAGNR